MSSPMKFMKSASSDGSKWARRFAISEGMRCVMFGPVIPMILANANRVYKHRQSYVPTLTTDSRLLTASRMTLNPFIASKQTKIACALSVKTASGGKMYPSGTGEG